MVQMVAINAEKFKKITRISEEVEPYIKDIIRDSNESNCPYKMLREGSIQSNEAKIAVTKVTRILYQRGLLNKMNLSLGDDEVLGTIWYAFGYWGGQTLNKHGNEICSCNKRCY
jgi:hypothetical protein